MWDAWDAYGPPNTLDFWLGYLLGLCMAGLAQILYAAWTGVAPMTEPEPVRQIVSGILVDRLYAASRLASACAARHWNHAVHLIRSVEDRRAPTVAECPDPVCRALADYLAAAPPGDAP